MSKKKVCITIDPKIKQKLEHTLIEDYGHVSGNISRVIESLIRDYVSEKNHSQDFDYSMGE